MMMTLKKRLRGRRLAVLLALVAALVLSLPVSALSVGEAKGKGLVVETADGYLAAAPGKGSADVNRLVQATNAARKAKYVEIAKELNVDVRVVEKDFAKKLGGR